VVGDHRTHAARLHPGEHLLKLFGGGRRANPLVAMPDGADAALETVSDVLITHEHPDHFDPVALQWIRERHLPVWAASVDVPSLRRKGLDAKVLSDGSLGMAVEMIPAAHGRGPVSWMMGPVAGFYLAHPKEPSLLITSDAVLTEELLAAVKRLVPDLIVAPAGAANFGFGPDLLFSLDELVGLVKAFPGELICNHLEALDHCPTTRANLREHMRAAGLLERVHIPGDGEELHFDRADEAPHAVPQAGSAAKPGLQKWLTAKFSGT
jgi:hypothetical protein